MPCKCHLKCNEWQWSLLPTPNLSQSQIKRTVTYNYSYIVAQFGFCFAIHKNACIVSVAFHFHTLLLWKEILNESGFINKWDGNESYATFQVLSAISLYSFQPQPSDGETDIITYLFIYILYTFSYSLVIKLITKLYENVYSMYMNK